MGSVTHNVSVAHPDFGKAFPCPDCGGGPEVQARIKAGLAGYFGRYWMDGTQKLTQFTMRDFLELPEGLAIGKGKAIRLADAWARLELLTYADYGLDDPTVTGFAPSSSLILSGDPGMGKTCLAAAAFLARTEYRAGLAIEYNALMDCFIDQIDGGNASAAVRAAAEAPILFIDDLGNTFQREETQGRQRWLFTIINHRYNRDMPTIITTNLDYWRMVDQFSQKLAERLMERAVWCEVGGPSLRINYGREIE